jgi:hypothetical protein
MLKSRTNTEQRKRLGTDKSPASGLVGIAWNRLVSPDGGAAKNSPNCLILVFSPAMRTLGRGANLRLYYGYVNADMQSPSDRDVLIFG